MSLKPTSPGMRGSIGASGAGKTYGIREGGVYPAVAAGVPVAVLDIPDEWHEVPTSLVPTAAMVESVPEALEALNAGKRLVVLHADSAGPDELVGIAEELAAWARGGDEVRGLAIPEVHNVAPSSGAHLPPHLSKIATAWRHQKVALWWDSQRISLVSRHLTELSRELRLYAIVGDRDLEVVRGLATEGKELVARVREAAERLADHDPFDPAGHPACASGRCDHPGWHVRLGMIRIPPFELVRE